MFRDLALKVAVDLHVGEIYHHENVTRVEVNRNGEIAPPINPNLQINDPVASYLGDVITNDFTNETCAIGEARRYATN